MNTPLFEERGTFYLLLYPICAKIYYLVKCTFITEGSLFFVNQVFYPSHNSNIFSNFTLYLRLFEKRNVLPLKLWSSLKMLAPTLSFRAFSSPKLGSHSYVHGIYKKKQKKWHFLGFDRSSRHVKTQRHFLLKIKILYFFGKYDDAATYYWHFSLAQNMQLQVLFSLCKVFL